MSNRVSSLARPVLRVATSIRCMHTSGAVAAKRKGGGGFDGEAFNGQSAGPKVRESYSFGGTGSSLQDLTSKTEARKVEEEAQRKAEEDKMAATIKLEKRTTKQIRRDKFDQQMLYARQLLRSSLHWQRKLVRHGIFRRLAELADEPEQLRNVAALFPDWSHNGYTLDDASAETYIGRCISIGRPQIAVTLLINAGKHKFHLPSLSVARKLLQSLIANGTTIKNMLSYVSLYNAYGLPAAITDPATCAMVIDACIKNGSAEALEIARGFAEQHGTEDAHRTVIQSNIAEKYWRTQLPILSASLATLEPTPNTPPQATA
ncbi:hypothetical protein BKA62DRAFT_683073 [Auriculariales sp. MPI-PUGE-AT-0066]|nr:hypothetical protein BKA62DRAFT_683073 [Auriculariales sp. MPI-PUGE-AT-0066]